jgi:hypothetical protein
MTPEDRRCGSSSSLLSKCETLSSNPSFTERERDTDRQTGRERELIKCHQKPELVLRC